IILHPGLLSTCPPDPGPASGIDFPQNHKALHHAKAYAFDLQVDNGVIRAGYMSVKPFHAFALEFVQAKVVVDHAHAGGFFLISYAANQQQRALGGQDSLSSESNDFTGGIVYKLVD